MFEVSVSKTVDLAAPGAKSLRALVRSAFDSEAGNIRHANLSLALCENSGEPPEYLCHLRLVLIAEAPLRVVATSTNPSVAVTRALQRAQSVMNGRRWQPTGPSKDEIAA